MEYCEFLPREINRFRFVDSEKVVKTFCYRFSDDTRLRVELESCANQWMQSTEAKAILGLLSFEVCGNRLSITQHRARVQANARTAHIESLLELFNACHRQGLVFSDPCSKNIIYDGAAFRMIDFEPFSKVISRDVRQFRVTEPYFHVKDKQAGAVTYLTDRLALLGWVLRVKYGMRSSRMRFMNSLSELSGVCELAGERFLRNALAL